MDRNSRSRRALSTLALLTLAAASASAQGAFEPRFRIEGEDVSHFGCAGSYFGGGFDNWGQTIDRAGDVNGDGYEDFVVGAPSDGSNCSQRQGSVTVLSGLDGERIWSAPGFLPYSYLGKAVAGAGDVNADGVPDVIVGGPGVNYVGEGSGLARVYSGTDGSALHEINAADWPGLQHDLGTSVCGAGDLNGDGCAEFAVGVPYWRVGTTVNGVVLVFSGSDGSLFRTLASSPDADDKFGEWIDDAGDVDGDGIHDLVVGARAHVDVNGAPIGAAYVLSGANGVALGAFYGDASQNLLYLGRQVSGAGDVNGDGLVDIIVSTGNAYQVWSVMDHTLLTSGGYGESVSGAGDVNGDGFDDFVVGYRNYSYNGSNVGRFRLVAGGTYATIYSHVGTVYAENLGAAVGAGGDVNGDGFDDWVVGTNQSRVYVYLGRPPVAAPRRFDGDAADEGFGKAVAGVGDIDGDGRADLAVGAPLDDVGGTNAGSVRVLSGRSGIELYTVRGAPGEQLGSSVAGAGDVNGDGVPDLVVGAPFNDDIATDAGAAKLLSGSDGNEIRRIYGVGSNAGDRFGHSVASAGDVDGDGFDDVIVGAPLSDQNGVNSGSASLLSGLDGMPMFTWFGPAASAQLGYSVGGAGDVNGDNVPDLIVGAKDYDHVGSNSGLATVFSGFDGAELFRHYGEGAAHELGYSVSGAGDMNGDGYADVIVGAPMTTTALSGRAIVYAGPDGAELYRFDAPSHSSGWHWGASVSGAGDLNGDGYDDAIVGGPRETVTGVGTTGVARVYSGFDGGVLLYRFEGDQANNELGIAVARAGDVNGDGLDEVIVGAHLRDAEGLLNAGSAFVFGLGYPPNGSLPGGSTSGARLPPPKF